jgi:hypothetical protein
MRKRETALSQHWFSSDSHCDLDISIDARHSKIFYLFVGFYARFIKWTCSKSHFFVIKNPQTNVHMFSTKLSAFCLFVCLFMCVGEREGRREREERSRVYVIFLLRFIIMITRIIFIAFIHIRWIWEWEFFYFVWTFERVLLLTESNDSYQRERNQNGLIELMMIMIRFEKECLQQHL